MVTVADVARRAGVSTSTVSRVLARSGYASPDTTAVVVAAAKELGYVPNAMARGLKTQRSGLVAFIVPEVIDPYFFTTLAHGVEEVANQNGLQIILGNNDDNPAKERSYINLMLASAVEGMIITPSIDARKVYKVLEERGVPAVFVDRVVKGLHADTVRSDDAMGASLLVEHLASLGHRRIALVDGHPQTSVAADRAAGFRQAMLRAGLDYDESIVSMGAWSIEDAERRSGAIIASRRPFTALVGANLHMTIGALRALRRNGLRVPDDVALVSFNDLELAAEIDPFLTVLSQPIATMGRIGMGLLLDRIRGQFTGAPRNVVLAPSLIVRRSCGTGWPGSPLGALQ